MEKKYISLLINMIEEVSDTIKKMKLIPRSRREIELIDESSALSVYYICLQIKIEEEKKQKDQWEKMIKDNLL